MGKKLWMVLFSMAILLFVFAESGIAKEPDTMTVTIEKNSDHTVTVRWNTVEGATQYCIDIQNKCDGNHGSHTEGTFVQVTSRIANAPEATEFVVDKSPFLFEDYGTDVYRIRVTAEVKDGYSGKVTELAEGVSEEFTTGLETLGKPGNLRATTTGTEAGVIRWDPVEHAAAYRVVIDSVRDRGTMQADYKDDVGYAMVYVYPDDMFSLGNSIDISNYIEYTKEDRVEYRFSVYAQNETKTDPYRRGPEVTSAWFSFDELPSKKVEFIGIPYMLERPKRGQEPGYLKEPYRKWENDGYVIEHAEWYSVKGDISESMVTEPMKDGELFRVGYSYLLIMTVRTKNGYSLSPSGIQKTDHAAFDEGGYYLDNGDGTYDFFFVYDELQPDVIASLEFNGSWNYEATELKISVVRGKTEQLKAFYDSVTIEKLEYRMFGKSLDSVQTGDTISLRFTVKQNEDYVFQDIVNVSIWIDNSVYLSGTAQKDESGNLVFELGPVTVPEPSAPKPENLEVSRSQSGKPVLSWSGIGSAGGYVIYRKELSGGVKEKYEVKIATVDMDETTYTDTSAVAGKTYVYYVAGLFSDYPNPMTEGKRAESEQILCIPELPAVEKLTNAWYGVTIKWKPVSGFSVRVYRKAEKESKWTELTTTTSGGYYDKSAANNTKYSYALAWVKDTFVSNQGETKSVLYMVPPTISSVANVSGGVKVSWSAIPGANGYFVYRKDTQAGTWHMIGSTQKNLSFTDTTTESGVVYYYAIKSFVKVGTETVTSASSSAKNTIYLKNNFISKLSNQYSGTLKIEFSKTPNCTGYEIVYGTKADLSDGIPVPVKMAAATDKSITGLKKGTTYYVKIRAYKTMGGYTFYSNWSAIKSLTLTK